MSNSLRASITKILPLALVVIAVFAFVFVMNTDRSFAAQEELNNVEVTVDVPTAGTEIEKVSSYEQSPDPNVQIVAANPHYKPYGSFWPINSSDPSWYQNLYEGPVVADTPLYLEMSFYISDADMENYCWANTPNPDDPETAHDESEEGKYKGTVTVNGKQAEIVYSGTWERGKYLDLIVKLMPVTKERTALNSVEVKVDVPKCGTEIEKISTYEQSPEPNVQIVAANPHYNPYGSFWPKDSSKPSWYQNLYEGPVVGDTPLYLEMSFYISEADIENYYWANTPNADDPDTQHDESEEGKYTGTVTVNGKQAEIVYSGTWERGKYLDVIVKLMPEHDWDNGKVTTEPTATTPGVMTYTCPGCEATKTEPIPATGGESSFLLAQMTSKGSKALNISWTKVNGAAGYDIFLSKCNKGKNVYKPQKVKTITGAANTKWTKKGLKKKTAYKAYVKAYVMKDGQKTYVASSPIIHAFTSNGNKYYTNAKSVTVKKSKVSLKAGKTFKIKASVKKAKSGKKLISKGHAEKLRYISNNVKVAKVNGAGNITAVAKGTCKVYAYTVNGVKKAVKVTVK